MSRLEQMRQNFLQRLQAEQNLSRMKTAKSFHNVYHAVNHSKLESAPKPAQNRKIYSSPLRRTSSGLIDHQQYYQQSQHSYNHPNSYQHPQNIHNNHNPQIFKNQRWQYAFPTYPLFNDSFPQQHQQQQYYQDYLIQIPRKPLSRVKSWSHLSGQSSHPPSIKRKDSVSSSVSSSSPPTSFQQTVSVNKRPAANTLDVQQTKSNRTVKSQVAASRNGTSVRLHAGQQQQQPAGPGTASVIQNRKSGFGQSRSLPSSEHQCQYCSRKFAAQERLEKHSTICGKTFNKRRTVFDSGKQRLTSVPNSVQQKEKIENQTDYGETVAERVDKTKKKSFAEWKSKQKKTFKPEASGDVVIYVAEKSSNPASETAKSEPKACQHCRRIFAPNVISKHEIICEKIGQSTFKKVN